MQNYSHWKSLAIPKRVQIQLDVKTYTFCVWHSIRNNPNFAFGIKLSERMRFVKIKSPYAIRKQT